MKVLDEVADFIGTGIGILFGIPAGILIFFCNPFFIVMVFLFYSPVAGLLMLAGLWVGFGLSKLCTIILDWK